MSVEFPSLVTTSVLTYLSVIKKASNHSSWSITSFSEDNQEKLLQLITTPTTGTPVRVPPRRIPVHFRPEVEGQLSETLQQGIIDESSSPWMAQQYT